MRIWRNSIWEFDVTLFRYCAEDSCSDGWWLRNCGLGVGWGGGSSSGYDGWKTNVDQAMMRRNFAISYFHLVKKRMNDKVPTASFLPLTTLDPSVYVYPIGRQVLMDMVLISFGWKRNQLAKSFRETKNRHLGQWGEVEHSPSPLQALQQLYSEHNRLLLINRYESFVGIDARTKATAELPSIVDRRASAVRWDPTRERRSASCCRPLYVEQVSRCY